MFKTEGYFQLTDEKKEEFINDIVDTLIRKNLYLQEELNTEEGGIWKFYMRSFYLHREKALEDENYEMCEIIDKVIKKLEDEKRM